MLVYLLGRLSKYEPELYKAWFMRSQGLSERSAKAELLQTFFEAIEHKQWSVAVEFDAGEWNVSIAYRTNDERSFEASESDLGLALLEAYADAVEATHQIGGES